LFSFGSVLYHLCTGHKPFQGASAIAVIIAISRDTPEPIRSLNPRIPASLEALIVQMMSPHPDDRPASAVEVQRRLKSIADDLDSTQAIATPTTKGKTARPKPKADTQVLPANPGSGVIDIRKRPKKRTPKRSRRWPILVGGCVTLFALFVGGLFFGQRFLTRPAAGDPPAKAVDAKEKIVLLTKLKDVEREHWPFHMGEPKKGKDKKGGKDGPPPPPNGEDPVLFHNKIVPNAIFMHPPPPHLGGTASLTYALNQQYSKFETEVSLRDGPAVSEVPIVFAVMGDGKLLWKSRPVSTQADTQKCSVSVQGVKQLKIAVHCDGPPFGAHAVWLEPRLTLAK
jgi:serine/threonine protein kinase